jgi:hypothetical protein
MRLRTALAAAALAAAALTACTPAPVCQEDDPCWDCHSLGNRICGPATDADRAYAWAVWDYADGPRALKVDPSRPYRVDYVGSSLDYPRGLRPYDLPLVGKDGHWYVFRAAYTN